MNEENLSWGKVFDKKSLGQIKLPENMIKTFINNTNKQKALVVFTPRQNLLKIDVFPVEDNEIFKIQLKLTQFSGNTVKAIGRIIREMNIPKNLFTSGVCLKDNFCLYEAYIEKSNITVTIDVLKRKFAKVENVVDVIITKLEEES